MELEAVVVECYSGHRANERPRAIVRDGERLEVTDVLDRWYEGDPVGTRPALNYFKVRCDDGSELLLRYNTMFDSWAICL